MRQYKNSFYNPKNYGSKEYHDADRNAILYCGYEIHRYSVIEYHIVKNDICIGMYAGINGAKRQIERLNNDTL